MSGYSHVSPQTKDAGDKSAVQEMAYQHGNYPFRMSQTQPERVMYHPQMQYPGFHPQIGQPELHYNPYAGFPDYADDAQAGIYYGEFEDSSEISTRPRLTRDQVDILEQEFQKNPKPNSMLKRHLAATTNLNLPRVAVSYEDLFSLPEHC